MKTKNKDLYIIEIIMLFSYIILKYLSLRLNTTNFQYFDLIFYFLFFILFYFKYGIPRDKKYLKRISIRYKIILLLIYLIVSYILGCFTGFVTSIYNNTVFGIVRNAFPIFVVIICKEIIRYSVANKSATKKLPIILLTIIFIAFELYSNILITNLTSFFQIFNFICLVVLPTIAKEMLFSYITYNISCIPVIIYDLAFEIVPFILPIYPDLGNYLNAILNVLFPFLVYLVMKKMIEYKEKAPIKTKWFLGKIMLIPIGMFLITLIVLISGVFNYKMIAIGSDSMNPIYYRGDAVIYYKTSVDDIKEGDILVFESTDNVITHRVTRIIERGNKMFFQTKGDNNETVDANLVDEENVLGTVKYIVKYIGYPTVWLNERF